VLWGGLLESRNGGDRREALCNVADQLLRERSNDHKLPKLWGDLKPRHPAAR
jgi:hypothetical protein